MFHRCEQLALFGKRVFAVRRAQLSLLPIALTQHLWIEQFVIAVGQLDAAHIQLEPLGDRRMAVAHAGQRGLSARIVVQNRRTLFAQLRLNSRRKQIVENQIAVRRRW